MELLPFIVLIICYLVSAFIHYNYREKREGFFPNLPTSHPSAFLPPNMEKLHDDILKDIIKMSSIAVLNADYARRIYIRVLEDFLYRCNIKALSDEELYSHIMAIRRLATIAVVLSTHAESLVFIKKIKLIQFDFFFI
jgi:hypothetical protein